MKRKGFTLIELMVVVTIIGLLIAILLPSLGAAREAANRIRCAANLSGFGKTFKIYAANNNDQYPAVTLGKKLSDGSDTSNKGVDTQSSLWLMILTRATAPETLICPSDRGAVAFSGEAGTLTDDIFPKVNPQGVKDTGGTKRCYSYSYQIPNGDTGNPGKDNPNNTRFAIMADRAPYDEDLTLLTNYDTVAKAENYLRPLSGPDRQKINSPNHAGAGQNVLFQDGHAEWKSSPLCGIQGDNIYTRATNQGASATAEQKEAGRVIGEKVSTNITALPATDDDSVLCNVLEGVMCTDPAKTTP